MENTALAPAVFAPAARDRATVYVAGAALAALMLVPWAAGGGPSALVRAWNGDAAMWPLLAATVIAMICAAREYDRAAAIAAGGAIVWALAAAFAAGRLARELVA